MAISAKLVSGLIVAIVVLIILFGLIKNYSQNSTNLQSSTTIPIVSNQNNLNSSLCNQSLRNHVYNPKRLQIINRCIIVTGIVDAIKKPEADGDYHILLKLDPQYANLINSANIQGQNGDLVLEPICQNRVTQSDAISSCANFSYYVLIPSIGSHVQVIGSYVNDTVHGWMEIHPVTSIKNMS